ncbi:MAG: YggS family pyridoxal phosphate-dependent enzyme [Phycisphaerales bacterium]|nr:YggS family pyridoxal phosphate-dependent enzyme [Phycisphaerales bacterium]
MPINVDSYHNIRKICEETSVLLVVVSKYFTVDDIQKLYDLGQRHFGESYVQKLIDKQKVLPDDIKWHFIGHLQSNKVAKIVPFISLIQSVDSIKLLHKINDCAKVLGRTVPCLLELKIAKEKTKYGLSIDNLSQFIKDCDMNQLTHTHIDGVMVMGSFTSDAIITRDEFKNAHQLFKLIQQTNHFPNFKILSMGMSDDFEIALAEGSNMVRVGSKFRVDYKHPLL